MDGSETGTAGWVEDLYRRVREAVETRRPIAAVYHDRFRLLCPHRLGRNRDGQLRVLSYQFGGESERGLGAGGIARQLALYGVGGTQRSRTPQRRVANSP